MKWAQYFYFTAILFLATASAHARGLGSPALPLQIDEWLKGEPVQLADGKGKNVYVVMFWSSKDPHSRAVVPHVSAMQEKYEKQDVIFVAVTPDDLDAVKTFVEDQADQIKFRVALDSAETTTRLYFQSVHNRELPHAYIVDKEGVMVWHGHPMGGLDKTIAAVLDGSYDIETGRHLESARGLKILYLQLAASPGKVEQCDRIGLNIVEYGGDDMMLMNDFAWRIATEPGMIKRDLDLALKAVLRANEGTKGENPDVLDTYARVLFERGDKQGAVKQQREAVKYAREDQTREALQKTLERYEKALVEEANSKPTPEPQD